jgi:hypothetical protein
VSVIIALSGCTSAPFVPTPSAASTIQPSGDTAPPSARSPAASPTIGSAPSPSVPTLASGAALPACVPEAPKPSATVTFVASGHAWALSPDGDDLTCLFAIDDAGPFSWGPLGDRALVGGLEVKGVAGGPNIAPTERAVATLTWSRPTGKSIVYASAAGTSLKKVHIDGSPTQDVSPLKSSTYLSVVYHPSGEAFAVAVARAEGQSIWLSSNVGTKPVQLVFSTEGTTFGAMGFDVDGVHLLYTARHADGHAELHRIDLTDPTQAPVVWQGPIGQAISDLEPGPKMGTVAWTASRTCADTVAMVNTPAGTVPALPGATGPTRSIGWLSATRLLVAMGGCGESLALSAVEISTGSAVPLVSGVTLAATRAPLPTPPAPLPKNVATQGSGFS